MQSYDQVRIITDRYAPEGAPRGAIGNIIEDFSDDVKLVQIWIRAPGDTPIWERGQGETPLVIVDTGEIELAPDD